MSKNTVFYSTNRALKHGEDICKSKCMGMVSGMNTKLLTKNSDVILQT